MPKRQNPFGDSSPLQFKTRIGKKEVDLGACADTNMQSVYEDVPETYEVIVGGSVKGGDLLADNRGYTYSRKRSAGQVTTWTCSNRGQKCGASVKQVGENSFVLGALKHNHEGDPGKTVRVKARVMVKAAAKTNVSKSTGELVTDALQSLPTDVRLPNFSSLRRAAIRARGTLKPEHPKNKDIEMDDDRKQDEVEVKSKSPSLNQAPLSDIPQDDSTPGSSFDIQLPPPAQTLWKQALSGILTASMTHTYSEHLTKLSCGSGGPILTPWILGTADLPTYIAEDKDLVNKITEARKQAATDIQLMVAKQLLSRSNKQIKTAEAQLAKAESLTQDAGSDGWAHAEWILTSMVADEHAVLEKKMQKGVECLKSQQPGTADWTNFSKYLKANLWTQATSDQTESLKTKPKVANIMAADITKDKTKTMMFEAAREAARQGTDAAHDLMMDLSETQSRPQPAAGQLRISSSGKLYSKAEQPMDASLSNPFTGCKATLGFFNNNNYPVLPVSSNQLQLDAHGALTIGNKAKHNPFQSIASKNIQCHSCRIMSPSLQCCSFCDRKTCQGCLRTCEGCQGSFCHVCSILNYDDCMERAFCLQCSS